MTLAQQTQRFNCQRVIRHQDHATPSTGEWRFNSELKYVEYYDGAAWFRIDTEAPANPDDFPSQNFNVNTYFGNRSYSNNRR